MEAASKRYVTADQGHDTVHFSWRKNTFKLFVGVSLCSSCFRDNQPALCIYTKAGARALSAWLKRCRATVGVVKGKSFTKLWGASVESVLLYGAEVWGC